MRLMNTFILMAPLVFILSCSSTINKIRFFGSETLEAPLPQFFKSTIELASSEQLKNYWIPNYKFDSFCGVGEDCITVDLRIVIDSCGDIFAATIMESGKPDPYNKRSEQIFEKIESLKFDPAEKNGERIPVEVGIKLQINK
ncbi:hypothetical protein ACL7TT_10420 [Microbulbifer sp. 2304DJ12-6]|uniref:hypothetical protein n=1 Tax=Microbulbifer sp. 2304DJ12-6 TaxID=3233340 RepID=UPI0039AF50D0